MSSAVMVDGGGVIPAPAHRALARRRVADVTTAHAVGGEMIGEVGFFSRGAATATVRAKTDMTVFSLPYNRFDSVLDENPAMLRAIAEELAHRLRDMDARHC